MTLLPPVYLDCVAALGMEKDGELSQDDHHLWADEIQSITDKHVETMDEMLATKQQEIMQV